MGSDTKRATPPDGGWGWMVVIGAGIVSMMVGMNYRIFGLVYLELREKFHGSATASVWVGGLNILLGGFCGPLTAWLLERYTHRSICVVGTSMAVIGMTSTGFVPNLVLTYATYGILLGIGISITSIASIAMVGTYFDKRKGLAMALQHSASGLSAFIFAPIMGHLMEEYNYSGTFLIFGAVFMNMFISCMIFRPFREKHKPRCEVQKDHGDNTEKLNIPGGNIKELAPLDKTEHPCDSECSNCDTNSDNEIQKQNKCLQCSYAKGRLLNPTYLSFFFVILAVTANRSVTVSFLPALALEMGATHQQASFLPAVGGITAAISSIVVGALFDISFIKKKRIYVYSLCALLSGVSVTCMPLTQNICFLFIPTAVNGACSTIAFAQQMTVLTDLLGKDNAVAGLGVTKIALALGSIIGRTVSSILVDSLETNTLGFYTISALPIIASVIFTLAIKCADDNRRTEQTEEEN